ncbi:YdiU family protein [Falsihalocynthiibacter sp. BN13B15]|uniref:protein adenylyltransferase SelO n=1 Tax=Falsihalocynthiibacter sp. BN13B15 TaxID=3240871 RepID=UPI00350E9990
MALFKFDNSYARLPKTMFAEAAPTPVDAPELLALNQELALELGLSEDLFHSDNLLNMLSGNAISEGSQPIAQAYAGHQFGNFVPRLGDGRAHLLGEVLTPTGARFDIALKGSGPTPYSRNGDGRAWLGPVLREFLVSEAMHAYGVPTTRALAIVATGERVQRETALPGAILTRVASSHLRVGTFQYFAYRNDTEALTLLTDIAIARHYPEVDGPLGLLQAAVNAQADLVAQWMGLGFIHGVMNTDNCHVGGITIDYGPCAFMDGFDPTRVFSSIDQQGRYAYQSQPDIAAWNLAQFASSLIAIMGPQDEAIAQATQAVNSFVPRFHRAWLSVFGKKIGFDAAKASDRPLLVDLLGIMAAEEVDFTLFFWSLSHGGSAALFSDPTGFENWEIRWKERLESESDPESVMARANPAVIPRNHRVEQAIQAAVTGDLAPFAALHAALSTPYERPEDKTLMDAPKDDERVYATFCGT